MLGLQDVCRINVRRILRKLIQAEHPNIGRRKRLKKPKRKRLQRRRRINIMPMGMGTIVLGNFPESDSEQEEGTGSSEGHNHQRDEEEEDVGHVSDTSSSSGEDEGGRHVERSGMTGIFRQMMAMQRHFRSIARRERAQRSARTAREDEEEEAEEQAEEVLEDQGFQEDTPEGSEEDKAVNSVRKSPSMKHKPPMENGAARLFDIEESEEESTGEKVLEGEKDRKVYEKRSANSDDCQQNVRNGSPVEMELSESCNSVSEAIPIKDAGTTGRRRYSSHTSMSTSCTSGIGTSVEEPSELGSLRSLDDQSTDITAQTPGNLAHQNGSSSHCSNGSHSDPKLPKCDMRNGLDFSANERASSPGPDAHDNNNHVLSQYDEEIVPEYVSSRRRGTSEEKKGEPENGCGPELQERCLEVASEAPELSVHNATPGRDTEEEEEEEDMECDKEENDMSEESECEAEPGVSYKVCMLEKVQKLPVPAAVKQYLMYYRT